MELTVVSSSSKGNSYVLKASNGYQLCIEAGIPLREIRKVAKLRFAKCVGVVVSHNHSDHCRYINDFAEKGIPSYSTTKVAEDVRGVIGMVPEYSYHLGDFTVTPIPVQHDVPCFSFLIHHSEMGTLYFFTDCYNMNNVIKGVDYYMCECNYEDGVLKQAVKEGVTPASQADRVILSHLSEANAIKYLQDCDAEKSAKKIILIHGSSRHLLAAKAVSKFQQVLGIPTYFAEKGLVVEL